MAGHKSLAVIGVDVASGIAVGRLVDDRMEPRFHAGDILVGDSSGNGLGDTLLLWDSGEATLVEVEKVADGDSCKFLNPAYPGFTLSDATLQRDCPMNYGVVARLTKVDGKYVSCRTRL